MANLATLRQRLVDAEGALHRLLMGELEVKVEVGGFGETIYNETEVNKLKTYIAELKAKIAVMEGNPKQRRKPILFKF